ncbi:hypothetical protein PIB30_035790 [Stylosanthes scabra]|uniref:Ubiquitin-like protease family profile domain-containing protein n=1 Tax=Stylosanthes scabra TaxID=79078 RepID=A0ABU6VCI8_9FABA|nr:hypothetical protein [Stylosanthes scabra]
MTWREKGGADVMKREERLRLLAPLKRSDSRCTPLKFRKIYDCLSDEKKALIDEMGLGAFQHLPNFYINHKILIKLVRSYDIFTNTISTTVGEFLITSEKIGHAFGLNCRRDLFEKRQKDFEDKLNDEEKQALNLFKRKSLTFVQDMVKDCPIETDQQKRTFKRTFALFIQKSFLLPMSSAYISPVHLPVIKDIDNTHGRNWAHHVNSFLINGMKEFHEQGSQAVKGCHFVLMIIYFRERYDDKSLNDPNFSAPWIQLWTGELMKDKIKAEDEDITGLIQRAKMRAQQQKKGKKKTDGEDEDQQDDADDTESNNEEEEYNSADDSETETDKESKKKTRRKCDPQPDPEPVSGPQPQPEPEAAILFGPEPQEVIDGFIAACQEVEETEAAIKACEEAELRYQQINQAEVEKDNEAEAEIRKIIEDVVTGTDKLLGRQEEAAPAPHKLDQPVPILMMVAFVAAQATEYDPKPETPVTSAVPATTAVKAGPSSSEGHPHNRDLKERCVMWALLDRKDIKYDSIFMIHGDIHFEVVRKQFRSMRPGKEVDAAILLNNEPIPRFQSDVYILPPSALSSMMETCRENYIDLHTRKIFAPVIYSGHWWMYVLDKEKKTFFVVDSKRKGQHDRPTIGLCGVPFTPDKRHKEYDCGTFVMKWMEVLDPTKLDAHSRYPIEDWSMEDLQRFRNDIIWQIILSSQNLLIQKAIQGAIETTIHKPSAALRSPYVQVNTDELKKLP